MLGVDENSEGRKVVVAEVVIVPETIGCGDVVMIDRRDSCCSAGEKIGNGKYREEIAFHKIRSFSVRRGRTNSSGISVWHDADEGIVPTSHKYGGRRYV